MEVNYRSYADGDEYKIGELLQLAFDGWPKFDINCDPVEHWKWKWLEHPMKRHSISVGEVDSQIIAVASSKYYPIWLVNGIYTCRQGGDLAVHPDYRGMRITSGNREYRNSLPAHNNTDISIGASGNDIILQRRKRLGRPKFPRKIKNYTKIFDFQKHTDGIRDQIIKAASYNLLNLLNRLTTVMDPSVDESVDIKKVDRFDERLDSLWDKVCDKLLFSMVRNSDIMNWRFADPRGGQYIIRIAEVAGELAGYSVLRINRYNEDYPMGFIVDLFSDPEDKVVKSALVQDAIGFFEKKNVNQIKCLVVDDSLLERVYMSVGFVEYRTNMEISARKIRARSDLWDSFVDSKYPVEFQYGDIDWI
jgi:hypothetical protein